MELKKTTLPEKSISPLLLFLPILIIPFIYFPFVDTSWDFRRLEILKIKTLFVIPASFIILLTGRGISLRLGILSIPLLMIFLSNLLSLLQPWNGVYSFQCFALLFGFLLIFLTFYKQQFKAEDLLRLLKIIVGMGVVLSFYSILQQVGIDPFGLKTWDGISVTFPNQNFLGGFLAFSLFFAISLFLKEETSRFVSVLAVTVIGDGLLFSETRGAWVAFLSGFAFLLFYDFFFYFDKAEDMGRNYLKKAPLVALIIFLTIISTSMINDVKKKPMNIRDRMVFLQDIKHIFLEETPSALPLSERNKTLSVRMRYLYWRMAVEMVGEAPFGGKGIGYFRENYYPYLTPYLSLEKYRNAEKRPPIGVDNDFLEFWVEAGGFNLLGYLLLMGLTYVTVWRFFRSARPIATREGKVHCTTGLLLGGVTVIISHGLFHYSIHDPTMGAFFWFSLALIHSGINEHWRA